MTSPCPPLLPVEILDLILLVILPSSPGLVGLLWSVLWSLLLLLDVVVISVVNDLTTPAPPLIKSVLDLAGLSSDLGGPDLLTAWTEV